jgi:hypothetical protein
MVMMGLNQGTHMPIQVIMIQILVAGKRRLSMISRIQATYRLPMHRRLTTMR